MDATGTIGRAWERMTRALFPFDFGKWISFGVIFFLQSLLEGGGTIPNRFGGRTRGGGGGGLGGAGGAPDWRDMAADAQRWIDANTSTVVVIGAVTIVVVASLGVLFLWLGTRGQMMSIRAVATGRAAIGEHWSATRVAAWSLFKTHLVISGVAFVLGAPLVVLAGVRVLELAVSGAPDDAFLVALLPIGVVLVSMMFVVAVVTTLLRNFVAPVMERCQMGVGDAWSHFRGAASGHWGAILLFLFIRFFFALGAGIVAIFAILCTCCLGALPVIHQAVMAPWYFFERAYGLEAIESLGPGMKMFDD